jgi:hypothetical protein
MEVRFDTFPLSWWCDSIIKNILRIFLVSRYRAVGIVTRVTCAPQSKCYLQTHIHREPAYITSNERTHFQVFNACFLLVKIGVTRTAKTLIAWKLLRKEPFLSIYRVYFASENTVARTSKTPYSRRAVNRWSPGWFVWAAPTLLRGEPDLFNEDNSLRGANTVVDSNPARVKAQQKRCTWVGYIHFQIFKYINFRWVSKQMFYQSKSIEPWTKRESNYRSTSLTNSK